MKKTYLLFSTLLLLTSLLGGCKDKQAEAPLSLYWEMGSNDIVPGQYSNTFYIINNSDKPLKNNWTLYFNQKQVVPQNEEDSPIHIERICATYYKMYPTSVYTTIMPGDTLPAKFLFRGNLIKSTAAPEGAYWVGLDDSGKELEPLDVRIEVKPFSHEAQWSRKKASELPYPYGEVVYETNEKLVSNEIGSKTDIFPSLKDVKNTGGEFSFTKTINIKYDPLFANEAKLLEEKLEKLYGCTISANGETIINLNKGVETITNIEGYKITLQNGTIDIVGQNEHAIFNGTQTILAMLGGNDLPINLPNTNIMDYPDVLHRGLMLDVARNFTSKENVLKLIDILAAYKMSVLHLHLTDDEGWRIEIPGLEELTEVGSRRGHTADESLCLFPAYGGGWDPTNKQSSGNGYFTREDFIEILKYAKQRHISVIPEVDLPGHARAAIKSMEVRYNKYVATDKQKAEEYLLSEAADTSKYYSAQGYTDNVINVALPSSYRFVEKVINELTTMYSEAGVEIKTLHMGGDEVARGAWTGSPLAQTFMKENNIKEVRELKDYFVSKTLDILKSKNMQLGAWQEVALLPDKTPNKRFANENVLSYCWSTIPEWASDQIPYKLANSDYPIILCNISNFYFDLAANKHQDEPGAYWAGFVNEYNSFDMLPYDIYRSVRYGLKGEPIDAQKAKAEKQTLNPAARKNIQGIQGQLWAETIRNFDMVEYYLFPKMYGLIERSWNTEPTWAETMDEAAYEKALQTYNTKIAQQGIPVLSRMGVNFRVPHPGLKIIDGKLYANSAFAGAEIRYTLDGSEPTIKSPLWKEAILCENKNVKAKAFYLGKQSVTTIMNKD